jgi:hypothetical protein
MHYANDAVYVNAVRETHTDWMIRGVLQLVKPRGSNTPVEETLTETGEEGRLSFSPIYAFQNRAI